MTTYYDYWVKYPITPAFAEDINDMIRKIVIDGGTYPSKTSVGTKTDSGLSLLHFRLPFRMNEAQLLSYLLDPMGIPGPPIKAMLIRSAVKNIHFDDTSVYEVLFQEHADSFLPFMPDDISYDIDGIPSYSKATPPFFLSTYSSTDPMEIV